MILRFVSQQKATTIGIVSIKRKKPTDNEFITTLEVGILISDSLYLLHDSCNHQCYHNLLALRKLNTMTGNILKQERKCFSEPFL